MLVMKKLLLLVGLIVMVSGSVFAGCIKGNCENGFGTYNWSNGDKYVGEWKNGKRYGKGKLTWSDGVTYEGEWKNNKMHGKGTYIWKNGDKYVGELKNDQQSGLGTKTYNDGRIEHGIWDGWTLIKIVKTKEQIQQEQQAQQQAQVDAQQKKMETCSAYGFEKGSEPFGQCIFKLMELDLEYAKLENETLRLQAQAEQAKLNNQAALANSLAAQAQASNRDKALRIQQFGLAMQGIANSFQTPSSMINPKITCNKFGNQMKCW